MKNIARCMVFFWLVSWTASHVEQRPCNTQPAIDPYTGSTSTVVNTVLCEENVATHMERRFETAEEAKEFVDGCPEGVCKDVAVEEVQ